MMGLEFVLIFVMAFGAAFVQRVTGFGFGIFIMTVLPYLLPSYGEATTLSGMLSIMTAVPILGYIWRHVDWRKLIPIMVTFLITSWMAVQLVSMAGDGLLKRILGAVLILASIWFYVFNDRVRVKPTLTVQASMGTLSGFMGGLFGMQGPPAVLYFLATAKDKDEYMALAQCYFLIGNIMMTVYRAQSGYLTGDVGIGWLFGVVAVFLGVWIGGKVFAKISSLTLRKLVYLYMAVSGLLAIIIG